MWWCSSMEKRKGLSIFRAMMVLCMMRTSFAALSPKGVNYEVVALMSIKSKLSDPHNALDNWDETSVDPCSWSMITCSADNSVTALGVPSQGLSGPLSDGIRNLTNLQTVLLQNNAISGPLPEELGQLDKLKTLDLSNNQISCMIPSSVGQLKNLNYLRVHRNPVIYHEYRRGDGYRLMMFSPLLICCGTGD